MSATAHQRRRREAAAKNSKPAGEVDLTSIKGIGKATATKLKKHGLDSIAALAAVPKDQAEEKGVEPGWIDQAKALLENQAEQE